MSWIEVGNNPWEVKRLQEISRGLWKHKHKNACFDPFLQPWMHVNFARKIGGCLKCSQFLRTDPSEFGRNANSDTMRT